MMRWVGWMFRVVVFLGALLLFLVEPMVARELLPVFGGSAAVWMTCLVFFQTALLIGYGYAHWLGRRPHLLWVHGVVLGGALLVAGIWAYGGAPVLMRGHPVASILLGLTLSIGLPFVVLGATSPLMQVWMARMQRGGVEYRLFGLSNVGSLLALAAYPGWVEGHASLQEQRVGWLVGVLVFVGVSGWLAWLALGQAGEVVRFRERYPTLSQKARKNGAPRALWFLLAMVGAMQLSAVTGHMTTDVAAIPLLWILPLGVYLATFVLAFEARVRVPQQVVGGVLAILLIALGNFMTRPGMGLPIGLGVGMFLLELLAACLFCHGELYRLRPETAEEATGFYLAIAAGGAVGAFLVGIAAPLVFRANYDLSIVFALTGGMALVAWWRQGIKTRALWGAVTVLLVAFGVTLHQQTVHGSMMSERNFYGSLRVVRSTASDGGELRTLLHGTITHGTELFPPGDAAPVPTTYYAPDSGVGLALRLCFAGRPRQVGVIGLGVGTLAAYARAGDRMRFYEINPAVRPIAENLFSYLRQSLAETTFVQGDGRAALAGEPAQGFDVLVVDAFSGDAIPLHLLTVEAMAEYARQLAPGGVLAFHVSNQFVDLEPELGELARRGGFAALGVTSKGDETTGAFASTWVLMSRGGGLLRTPELVAAGHPLAVRPGLRAWTDDRSSLLPLVRW